MPSRRFGALVIASAVHRRAAPLKSKLMRIARRVARQVSLVRALIEASLLVAAWFLLFRWVGIEDHGQVFATLASLASSAAALAAIRLRRVEATLPGLANELLSATIASVWIALVQLGFTAAQYDWDAVSTYLQTGNFSPFDAVLVWGGFTLLNGAVYVVMRTVVVGIPWWLRFQQRKLRWQLVHTQLLVVVLLGLIPLTLFGSAILRGELTQLFRGTEPAGNALVGLAAAIAFALAVTVVLLAIGMAVVLPPSILVSYIAARRTTRRLEHLAGTAAALRDGRLDARVSVQGVDEVAQLQADINAMAATMQRSMTDLSAERDTVRSLLQQRQELVASVSHELRTPVAIMRGYLDSALDQEDAIPVGLRHDLQVMHNESLRLQRLIDDLFVLTRASVAQLPFDIKATDLIPLLERCVAAVAPGAWDSGRVEVLLQAADDLPPVAVDPDRLTQIVLNVVTNAVRHSPPGGLVLLSTQRADGRIAVCVADTGEGIPADEIDRVWERFYRASNATDPRGSGLGLAISKELAEAMGGEVAVRSVPGEETVFTFWFPIASHGTHEPALSSGFRDNFATSS